MAFKLAILTFLAASLTSSFAAETQPASKPSPTPSPKFNLKTVLVDGDTSKNNLYLTSYHTGAGTADAVLVPAQPKAPITYLNGTQIQFAQSPEYQTWLFIYPDTLYTSWNPVTIDSTSGPTSGAFYFNNSAASQDGLGVGLKYNPNYPAPPSKTNNLFGGWYACDWYHNVPQLFWIIQYKGQKTHRIDTCSKVELVREVAK